MTSPRIRADYDWLAQTAGIFQLEAEHARQSVDRLRRQMAVLQNGDWVGQGAAAFYQEMSADVLPTLNRLTNALANAAETTQRISQLMQQTEAEAASYLRGPAADDKPRAGDISLGVGGLGFEPATPPTAGGGAGGLGPFGEAANAMRELLAARTRSVQAAYDKPHPDYPHNFQAAIDETVKQYGLDPGLANGLPTFDPDIHSRGLTLNDGSVRLGDGAFILSGRGTNISTGFLASTIGHELVHVRQLREGRWVTDPDDPGLIQNNHMSEVEAYQWELDHADHNGLSATERHAIETERKSFYDKLTPENKKLVDRGIFVTTEP